MDFQLYLEISTLKKIVVNEYSTEPRIDFIAEVIDFYSIVKFVQVYEVSSILKLVNNIFLYKNFINSDKFIF